MDERDPAHRDAPARSSRESASEPLRKVGSGKHSIYTHFPKDRHCDICMKTKITRAPCRKRTVTAIPRGDMLGDLITADHKVLGEGCYLRSDHRSATVVQDLATQWIQSYPCKTKYSQETQKSLMKFLEPTRKPKVIYTDNSMEFAKACEDLSWNHCTSTPHRSETYGIAERAVRRIKEGTSAVLLQSGLDEKWWADSMECYCHLRNMQHLLSDGKTHHDQRICEPSKGPIIPFGSMVEYHPVSVKDLSRLHQFGKKVLPGIFLGYSLYAGGIWKGDIMVADVEELVKMDASEIHAWGLDAKEVSTLQNGERYLPDRRWNSQTIWRRSGSENTHLDPGQPRPRRTIRTSSRRIRRVFTTTWRLIAGMMVRQEMISGPFQGTTFTVIKVNRVSNCTCRLKNHPLFHWNTLTWPETGTHTTSSS